MKKDLLLFIITIVISCISYSQNTIGTLTNTANSFNGYTLFTSQTETYLINNCGEVVNQWSSAFPPGNAVYLLEDGSLLRACRVQNNSIVFGGTGGRIEKYDWNGNLMWEYDYSTDNMLQHHDIYPLPNGNVLILAATVMPNTEAIQAGRNPSNLVDGNLFNEQIVELEPIGSNNANIVWVWNINDHLIQDFDATKDNFGIVGDNPQRLDINFLGSFNGINNWLHMNSIQYNEALDQIVMSSRHLNEIYIIDHSTSTAEAASSSGGAYGKGGDFLYRWGNPQAYRQGGAADQKLFGQHYPHWIPDGLTDAGKIILFNNGFSRSPSFSEIFVLTPPIITSGVYEYITGTAFGPENPDYTYIDNPPTNFFSRILSSAQRLPNGNTLICDGDSGYFFEIDTNEAIVWEYINPSSGQGILTQGDNPDDFTNTVFRAIRYDPNYSAFSGRDLTPGSPIELNADLSNCTILDVNDIKTSNLLIYPNPTNSYITIKSATVIDKIELFNALGSKINTLTNTNILDLSSYQAGIYVIKVYIEDLIINRKIIKR